MHPSRRRRALAAAALTAALLSSVGRALAQQPLSDALSPTNNDAQLVGALRRGAASGPCITPSHLGPAEVTLRGVQDGLCREGGPQFPVAELTVAGAHAAMADGSLNCSGLVQAYLQRIAAYDRRLQLNAIHKLNPRAVEVRSSRLQAHMGCMGQLGIHAHWLHGRF